MNYTTRSHMYNWRNADRSSNVDSILITIARVYKVDTV